jgi:hypothetical protein
MSIIHLFPDGKIKVGTPRLRRLKGVMVSSHRWTPAYSRALPRGKSMCMSRRDWQSIATRHRLKLKFHQDETSARAAIR